MTTPRPAPGTRLLFLDTEAVLFCEPSQELHYFNTTATVIWCHLLDGLQPHEIAHALRACDPNLSGGDAERFVTEALADWQAKHLLGDGKRVATPAPARKSPLPARPASDRLFTVIRRYALLDAVMTVRFSSAAQAAAVDPILRHLHCDRPANFVLDIVETADGIMLYRDGEAVSRCDTLDGLAPEAKHLVWGTALLNQTFLAQFHAGVVAGPAGCVLLPAVPGSGKSTLTAALAHAGFTYYSDEVALLQEGSLTVRPFPLALCVKQPGIPALLPFYPGLAALPVHHRADGKRVSYMPLPADRLPPEDASSPVCGLFFPRFVPGSGMVARDLSAAEALQRLLGQCLCVPNRLSMDTVRSLVTWIMCLPAVELIYSDLPAAVASVGAILTAGGPLREARATSS